MSAPDGAALLADVRRRTVRAVVRANVIGAAVVICFALFVLPRPVGVTSAGLTQLNLALAVAYPVLALLVGVRWGRRRIEDAPDAFASWVPPGRAPDARQRAVALVASQRLAVVQAVLWGGATLLFFVVNASSSGLLALGVALTVALGGITTSAAAFLLAELALQPILELALREGVNDPDRSVPRLAARWLLSWGLGTGVPVLGLLLVGIFTLTATPTSVETLAVTIVALCAISLTFGAVVTTLAAYATVAPVAAIRRAVDRVRAGDLDADVEVWDTTELGLLQAGFNDMVGGLREREHIRDLFGRQVGADVARQALAQEIRMGGERRRVAVLFVDLVGSTSLAADREPEEVVDLLNRFFAVVVEAVEDAGGSINKFEGDAGLAVFGAPLEMQDPAGSALRCARDMGARLRTEVAELRAGIGVAHGAAVAGNIGAEQRYEYTVIGDPVNQAARLTELAKEHDERTLASAEALDAAEGDEAERWRLVDEVTLRGRREPTRVGVPRPAG